MCVWQARAARLPTYGFLGKGYLERILRPEEVRPCVRGL